MILGTTAGPPATAPANLPTDQVYVRRVTLPAETAAIAAVIAFVDGMGPGAASGSATVTPVVYDAVGALRAVGPAVTVAPGAPGRWVTLRLNAPGVRLAGDAWIGLRAAGANNAIRLASRTVAGFAARTCPAVGAPPGNLSAAVASNLDAGVFTDVVATLIAPLADDLRLARVSWALSQRYLSRTAPIPSTRRTATAGWHGEKTDPHVGALCIVRSDGPLADLVGERLRVTRRVGTKPYAIAVYCHDEQDFPDEIADESLSLPFRAFLAIAPVAYDSVPVTVEVLA